MSHLLRTITLDLDQWARGLLVREDYANRETTLEVYRHVVVTGEERGRRWRKRDPWAGERYPGFHKIVGATYREWLADTRFALTDHRDMSTHVPRIITRAVLGNDPTLSRWRRDQGDLSALTLDVRLRRARNERFVSLDALLSSPRGRTMAVQFNHCHADARVIIHVLLIPRADGWALGIEYGCPDDAKDYQHGAAYSSWIAWQPGALGPDDPEHKIPMQRDNEPTSLFVRRCVDYIESITGAS